MPVVIGSAGGWPGRRVEGDGFGGPAGLGVQHPDLAGGGGDPGPVAQLLQDGQGPLVVLQRLVLAEYETYFNEHRPHRALNQASPLRALPEPVDADIKVTRRDRLGGLLHEYAQVA